MHKDTKKLPEKKYISIEWQRAFEKDEAFVVAGGYEEFNGYLKERKK